MSFGPYLNGDQSVFVYDRFKEEAGECGLVLEAGKNFYDRVLDFNWLKQDKSPNWDIVGYPNDLQVVMWLKLTLK